MFLDKLPRRALRPLHLFPPEPHLLLELFHFFLVVSFCSVSRGLVSGDWVAEDEV
jgi:hypothetical protein